MGLKDDLEEAGKVRDLAGKNAETLKMLIDIEDGVKEFIRNNEDMPAEFSAETIADYKAKVRNRKKKIREITDTWPAPN